MITQTKIAETLNDQSKLWNKNCIFMSMAGSHAYGTTNENSDIDYRGVFLPDPEHVYGLSTIKTHCSMDPIDLQTYELRHFMRLCLKGSPQQVEMLFYPKDCWRQSSRVWNELILPNRHLFITKRLFRTLGGFAQGDIKRIKGELTGKCGAKGKKLIEKYGFNVKHAANAYRLLSTSLYLWKTGEFKVRVEHPNKIKLLRGIQEGKFTKDEVLGILEMYDISVKKAFDKSNLPANPDFRKIEDLTMKILKTSLDC